MNITKDFRRRKMLYQLQGVFGALAVVFSSGYFAVLVYRFGKFSQGLPFPLAFPCKALYFILFYVVQSISGISVQAYSKIGPGFSVLDSGSIFVVAECIGENFTVSPGVTVGNVRGSRHLPMLGNNVYIEPGAKVLGEISIGDNVVIRANSLVLANVPDNSIAQGNPARILSLPEGALP